jgi:uncharacterized small protein (DUF1192 family)
MLEEPAPPRPTRGQLLVDLGREDLELYSVEELQERIDKLNAEAARAEAQLERKRAGRAAADALFKR